MTKLSQLCQIACLIILEKTFSKLWLLFFSFHRRATLHHPEWVHWRRRNNRRSHNRFAQKRRKRSRHFPFWWSHGLVGGDLHFADGKATERDFIHKKRSSQHSPTSFMSAKYRSFCFKHPRLLSAAPDPTHSVVLGAHMNHIYELYSYCCSPSLPNSHHKSCYDLIKLTFSAQRKE